MNNFKVGQYVVFKDDPYLIHKVVKVVNDNQVELEYPNCGCVSHRIVGIALIRQALNIDYIHTLPAEQMVKVFRGVYYYGNCDMCVYDHHLCGALECDKGNIKWFNKNYDGWEITEFLKAVE